MGNLIKLSKSDWIRIGREQGFLGKQSQFMSGCMGVYHDVKSICDSFEKIGEDNIMNLHNTAPELDEFCWKASKVIRKLKDLVEDQEKA